MSNKAQVSKKVVSSDAFKFHFKFWRILGIYLTTDSTILYVVMITMSTSLPVGMIIFLFEMESLKDILTNLSTNISAIAIILKFANIFSRRESILDVNAWVRQLDSRSTSAQEQEYLRSAVHTAHRMFYVTLVMFIVAVAIGEFGAFLSLERRLVCPAWYPFDWRHSTWKYSIARGHQSVVFLICLLQNVSSDTFPAIYMHVLKTHVKTLNIRTRRLGMDATESWQATNAELIQCIKDQQMYFHTVRKVTSPAIFVQFLATVIDACITAVCVFCVEGNLFEAIFFGQYFLCIILEIALYCYFGDELVVESSQITDAIYSCNWMDQDKMFKKNLLVFMQSTQEGMTIVAGGIFPVNLTTFVSVLKSSYSFFAVLMTMT
ncbi:odorant receptor 2a-like isoform X2 [Hermetia illucens]|uniref:odorant receptor 2a-like isoform X2 n=1 Tax=Hermetia illucens TaxID=343691 RepID=UPI0018CC49BF|nr:odorant receptor 2a-like isoform X2 [Hermetia illucens]